MRLQTAKHRVVRLVRAALTLVMFGLIGILSWNFAIVPRLPIPNSGPRGFQERLSALTEGLTFQHTEGDRTFYTLKARTHQSFKDAPHLFQGVEVMIYGNGAEPNRRISSDECTYDQVTGDIEFRGNVVAHLDEQTTGKTAALSYRNQGRVASTRSRVFVERPDEMTAAANSMEFGVESGVLKLAGKVQVTLAQGAELESDTAVFHQKESWATAIGNVFVRSMSGWARGDHGRAELEPDSFRPRNITIRGNVTAETRSAKSDDVWKLTRAGMLNLVLGESGGVERAMAAGEAMLEKVSPSGNRKLSGGELIAWVDERGEVERVEASQPARLEAGGDGSETTLTANTIRIDPAGTIVTAGASTMDSKDATIKGTDFTIEQGDIATFATSHPATVDTRRPGDPPRHMKAERSTTARIDSKTNRLISMVSIGAVQFTDGDRRGNADKATALEGGDTMILEGSARVEVDPKTQIYGQRIEIGQRGSTFKASGAVKTVSQTESGPVTVMANEARGSSGGDSERVFYSGNVKTTTQSASGPLSITADDAVGNAAEMTYTGKAVDTVVKSDTGAVRIVASKAEGNADKMTFSGAPVQLWRERDGVYIESNRLEVFPKEKTFEAKGNVVSHMDTLDGRSATLKYDDGKETARYSGNVKLTQKDMRIEASTVTAMLVQGKISEATAEGAVIITQAGARGSGDSAVYRAKDDKAILTGNPAYLVDPVRGNAQGKTVTVERAEKNATINGGGAGESRGRVTSKTIVKP